VREPLSAQGAPADLFASAAPANMTTVTDAGDADAHFAVCGEVLGDIRPAATLVVVTGLYKPEMKVEIEVTAKRRSA